MTICSAASLHGRISRNITARLFDTLRVGLTALALTIALSSHAVAASTINAKNFIGGAQYLGTDASPFPGSAIAAAINRVGTTGTTVFVPAGVWLIEQKIVVNKSSFTLKGDQGKSVLRFRGAGQLFINGGEASAPGVASVVISNFTIDAAAIDDLAAAPIYVRNCSGCRVSYNQFGARPMAGSIAVLMLEGGSNGTVSNNAFTTGYLQLNPLGGTPNSGFLVSQNTFDSASILLIGVSASRVTRNTMTNSTLGNPVSIRVAAIGGVMTSDVLVDYNILDATLVPATMNFAMISGVPQDPTMKGTIKRFYVRNNTLRGSNVYVNAQVAASGDQLDSCLRDCDTVADTYDFVVTGNTMLSYWSGVMIDLRGGVAGLVNGATVRNNTLTTPWPNAVHRILRDEHTYAVTIGTNTSNQAIVNS